jgi:hypothetical protein
LEPRKFQKKGRGQRAEGIRRRLCIQESGKCHPFQAIKGEEILFKQAFSLEEKKRPYFNPFSSTLKGT